MPTVFPLAPLWWPGDWGHLPITLPWEVSLYRSQLVSADPDDAVWKEVYQKFLEQLAGGWDLYYSQIEDKTKVSALPSALARAIVDAGGFSFCAGSVLAPSFRRFLQIHSMSETAIPDQRGAKNAAWKKIDALKKERTAQRYNVTSEASSCLCESKLARAVRRLGVEAQVLEAAGDDTTIEVTGSIEKLAALTSAALSAALNSEQLITRVDNLLGSRDRSYYCRQVEEAFSAVRGARSLNDYLSARLASNLSRLS